MATGTQLYNNEKKLIYPNSLATLVQMEAGSFNKQSAESCIIDLYDRISELSGLQQQKNNIIIEVSYCRTKDDKEESAVDAKWEVNFTLPDSNYPYAWKKTVIKTSAADSDPKVFYEIVAADIAERNQTIYLAPSSSTIVEVQYEYFGTDEDGKPVLNDAVVQQDDWLPKTPTGEQWSYTLMDLSAVNPEIYSATRTKKNGRWGMFSKPVRIAKWTFDSIIKLKYTTTELDEDPPILTNTEELDNNWSDVVNISDDFTGKIWMASATFVNGSAVKNTDNTYWSGPNLMSIIK